MKCQYKLTHLTVEIADYLQLPILFNSGLFVLRSPIFTKPGLATANYLQPKQQWVTQWHTVQK